MKPKWWHTNDKTTKAPDWHPVDLTCPCCRSNVVGDVAKRIVVIRLQAQCDGCGAEFVAEYKHPLPDGKGAGSPKGRYPIPLDELPF